ncbi:MAG: hypothetical protein D6729_13285 [Deltaproteobacteria bacterium]|nr:MAG: hypothetical protein D6729_13285 [Deltaproteobacteria bacterium]
MPPAYRFLTQAHVDVSSDGSEAGKAWVIKVQRGEAGLKVGDGVFPFSLPDREASPPALIDAFIPLKDAPIVPGKPLSGQGVDLLHLTGEPTGEALDALARTLAAKERRYQAGGKVNFCHIVPERYRLAVYARLAKQRGRCRRQYQKLLKKAKEDAAVPKGTVKKPPARRPRSLPETPPPPSPRPAPPGAPAPGPAKGTGAKD